MGGEMQTLQRYVYPRPRAYVCVASARSDKSLLRDAFRGGLRRRDGAAGSRGNGMHTTRFERLRMGHRQLYAALPP